MHEVVTGVMCVFANVFKRKQDQEAVINLKSV